MGNFDSGIANIVFSERDNVRQLGALFVAAGLGLLDLVAVLPPDKVNSLVQVIETMNEIRPNPFFLFFSSNLDNLLNAPASPSSLAPRILFLESVMG